MDSKELGHLFLLSTREASVWGFLSCLGKHLDLVRCGIPASSHVAEVEQVAEGGDDRVEEEAQPQKQQELVSPRLQR